MKRKRSALSVMLVLSVLINLLVSPFAVPALAATLPVIDDFEAGLPTGTDANGVGIVFITSRCPNSSVALSTTATPPSFVPCSADPNHVLKIDLIVISFAGFVQNFENAAVDTWV